MKSRSTLTLAGITVQAILLCTILLISSCTGPPEASDISLVGNPNEHVPLAGILSFTSDRPVVTTLVLDDGVSQRTVIPDPEPSKDHRIPVLGLYPDTHYTITATISDEDGQETTLPPMEMDTPALPEDFPPIELTTSATAPLEPGITMVNVFRWKTIFEDDSDWGLVFGVDETGKVVWYYKSDMGISEARRMHNGNLFFGGHLDGRMYEIDMLGNLVNEWHSAGAMTDEAGEQSIAVNTDTFHHDIIETSNGNFIALGLEVRRFEDFPLDYPPSNKRGPANVACDVVIEFTPEGETVREHNVADILDPERLGAGSLMSDFYSKLYKDRFDSMEMPLDITHANALYYVEEEDALIVSMNVQCAIFKIDMETGDLKWILGDPTNWAPELEDKLLEPVGDVTWPCHQHGLEMTSNGTLLMFDNGGGRSIPPNSPMAAEDRYSRAVEYRINESEGTIEEVWSYGPEQERFISPFISDADQLTETGHILIADGGRFMDKDGKIMSNFGGHQWGRVLEVTRDDNPQKLWEITIKDPEQPYSIYRAQRLKSLYPKLDKPTG